MDSKRESLQSALDYLQRFLNSRIAVWHETIREAGPANHGSNSDLGDNEARSILRDLVLGLEDEFEDSRVPEGFSSPAAFIGALQRYEEFSTEKLERLKAIKVSHGGVWHRPVQLAHDVLSEVQDAIEHVLELVGTSPLQTSARDRLTRLLSRMPEVSRQLLKRYGSRAPFVITDEYDIQDLLRALLHVEFSDVRPEEWNPSYAGRSSRTDFLLPEARIAVEVKHARSNHSQNAIVTELNTDAKFYRGHPSVEHLICVVWDTGRTLSNPTALKADVERHEGGFVTVIVLH